MTSPKQAGRHEHLPGANILLAEELSKVLPKDAKFEVYHLSTPPTATDALHYPPAQESTLETDDLRPTKPLRTYCEKHFLALSIDAEKDKNGPRRQVIVLGLEIYIYTTALLTTIFVSKADSTGYLNLLNLPKGTPSPIREVTVAFIAFLIAVRRRPAKQLVVSLFARSQSQYLFPGSVHNNGKHILNDRSLVKWWCRVLNSLVTDNDNESTRKARQGWYDIYGHLVVPGLDEYEARPFLPRSNSKVAKWILGDPLGKISTYINHPGAYGLDIPIRCLIPTFPDDPKARFVEELEEATPTGVKLSSGWRTPQTLHEFWEMMAFRQECSSGRMTGFIWVVFYPVLPGSTSTRPDAAALPTPSSSFSAPDMPLAPTDATRTRETPVLAISTTKSARPFQKESRRKKPAKRQLRGLIVPRQPQTKTHNRIKFPDRTETPYYYWPEAGRGQVVLDESGYNRAVELLLHLEFSKLDVAVASSTRWIGEVNIGAKWGLEIFGRRENSLARPEQSSNSSNGNSGAVRTRSTVNNLSGMVRRKRSAEDGTGPRDESPTTPAVVNILGAGIVRKKAKTSLDEGPVVPRQQPAEPKVNVLGAGLVRKKAKTAETKA